MSLVKNVFVQVNTPAIQFNPSNILENTLIFDQGTMVMGTHVAVFDINLTPGDVINFVILPLQLYTTNTVFFTGFRCDDNPYFKIHTDNDPSHSPQVSFSISLQWIDANIVQPVEAAFSLSAVIYSDGATIPFTIDPVLRIKQ